MSPPATVLITSPLDPSGYRQRHIARFFRDGLVVYRVFTIDVRDRTRSQVREVTRLLFALSAAFGATPAMSRIWIDHEAVDATEQVILDSWKLCHRLEQEREQLLADHAEHLELDAAQGVIHGGGAAATRGET